MNPKTRLLRFWGGALLGLVTLFTLLHLQEVQAHILLPWSCLLAELAARTLSFLGQEVTATGTVVRSATLSLNVSESCGGLEVVGLYLACTLAYPAPWHWRLWGVACGLALFQGLNFLRILSFFWLQEWLPLRLSSGQVFSSLHLYLWPGVMVGVGSVLWGVWVSKVRGQQHGSQLEGTRRSSRLVQSIFAPSPLAGEGWDGGLSRLQPCRTPPHPIPLPQGEREPTLEGQVKYLMLGLVILTLLLLFPPFSQSSLMQRFAAAITTGAAWVLSFVGVPAVAQGFFLRSGTVTLDVLPGCVATPLLILYVAGVLVWPLSWKGKGLLVALGLPLFYLLNVVRVVVLVLAEASLPGLGDFLYDFFFQLCLLGGMTLGMGGWISTGVEGKNRRRVWLRLALGYGGALVVWQLGGRAYEALVFGSYKMILGEMGVALPESLPYDPNRVLSYLPAFQMVIFCAFTLACFGLGRWQHLVLGGLWLYLSQLFFLLSLSFLGLTFHSFPHVRYLRAWVLTVPFLLVWLLWRRGQARGGGNRVRGGRE